MLGLAKRCKARFLITSTSEVYGDPLEHPQTEKYWGNVNPIGERSCYDEGELCIAIVTQHAACVAIVRSSFVVILHETWFDSLWRQHVHFNAYWQPVCLPAPA